ncbi:hypothetical protein LP7551_00584 [Roseibium album]|nr:hypothetical protein LP7551_00584 [Roseibium album]
MLIIGTANLRQSLIEEYSARNFFSAQDGRKGNVYQRYDRKICS